MSAILTVGPPRAGALSWPAARRRVELVDPLEDGRWEAFVAREPAAAIFHHRAWLQLVRRTFGVPVVACCTVDASGRIRAGAPLALLRSGRRPARLTCLPCSDHCPPLPLFEQSPALSGELVIALDRLRRSMGVPMELRGPLAPHAAARVSARYRAHRIVLGPEAGALARDAGAAPSARDGLVIERRTDSPALHDFQRLQAAARRRQGAPVPPRRFTLGFAELFDRGLGFLLVMRRGGHTVAGALFTSFNRTLVLRGAAAAPGRAPAGADRLLLAEAIRRGRDGHMRTLELGLSDVGDQRLRADRLSLGVEERLLEYHELRDEDPLPARSQRGRWAAATIRHAPPIVSRAVGEAHFRRLA